MDTITAAGAPDLWTHAGLSLALARWLPRRRWFGDKERPLTQVRVIHASPFTPPSAVRAGFLAVVRAEFADRADPSHYLVPLALGPARRPDPETTTSVIVRLGDAEISDALADPELVVALVRSIATGGAGSADALLFVPEQVGLAVLEPGARVRMLDVEQSNTSVVINDRHLLKVFRRLRPGINPELDTLRLLRADDCPAIPPLEGAIHGPLGSDTATYAVLQEFIPNAEDGWSISLRAAADDDGPSAFAASMQQLGAVVARVHAGLAACGETAALTPAVLRRVAREMTERLDNALNIAPELAERRERIAEVFAALSDVRPQSAGLIQRVHGDLHLGQVLRADSRWFVVDFEGEPDAPFTQRTALHPPERDLAGMLRSIDYAAAHETRSAPAGDRRDEWAARTAGAFLSGYRSAAGKAPDESLLHAYLLDKSVYELCYERRNRPSWAAIPLSGIDRLLAGAQPAHVGKCAGQAGNN